MRLHDIADTSKQVSETSARLVKVEHLTSCLQRLAQDEIAIGVAYLSGELRQGRIGIGPAVLRDAFPDTSAKSPALTLAEVDHMFDRIAAVSGPGSSAERARLLRDLFARATSDEQDFLGRLILGELRQGALEGLVVEAVARAVGASSHEVRRAVMVSGDMGTVARLALAEGAPALARFRIQLFSPVLPMLAHTAGDVGDALTRLGTGAFEYKLDGARVQIHKAGQDVRVFSRRPNDVTTAIPEIAGAAGELSVGEIILDGEVLALRADGRPHPFQTTMHRFGRKLDVERMQRELPLTPFFFDCLYLDGENLIDRPAEDRFVLLSHSLPAELVIRRIVTSDEGEAKAFLRDALRAGHEGLMAKALDAPYEAGGRGQSWLKVKPAHTLDLVVLAAEWGHGRRRGCLSNLHLAARDPATGDFVMLGKTFKGMTDEMLRWQTERLKALHTAEDQYTVYVRPEMVVEVAFDQIQVSPQYPSGMALRFARVKRYRPDKTPDDADTIDAVRAIYEAQTCGLLPESGSS